MAEGDDRSAYSPARRRPNRLALVVPCFNEEDVLGLTIPKLEALLDDMISGGQCAPDSFVVYVDDGSRDRTWPIIEAAATRTPQRIRALKLAANVGHQGALLGGLDYVTGACDAAISLDADLQDDLGAIPQMMDAFEAGAELVLGVRDCRDTDTWFKRTTALGFYRSLRWLGVKLIENHADFRLMSDVVLRNLQAHPESNLFLRGLVPILHQNVAYVYYARAPRLAGETKYPLGKMVALALNGITSFSVQPLRMITYLGMMVFAASLAMVAYALTGVMGGQAVPGWASVVIPLYLLGGLIMVCLGIVGEYVGRIFVETKARPRFFVDRAVEPGPVNRSVGGPEFPKEPVMRQVR